MLSLDFRQIIDPTRAMKGSVLTIRGRKFALFPLIASYLYGSLKGTQCNCI
jgi:hypothetical protein